MWCSSGGVRCGGSAGGGDGAGVHLLRRQVRYSGQSGAAGAATAARTTGAAGRRDPATARRTRRLAPGRGESGLPRTAGEPEAGRPSAAAAPLRARPARPEVVGWPGPSRAGGTRAERDVRHEAAPPAPPVGEECSWPRRVAAPARPRGAHRDRQRELPELPHRGGGPRAGHHRSWLPAGLGGPALDSDAHAVDGAPHTAPVVARRRRLDRVPGHRAQGRARSGTGPWSRPAPSSCATRARGPRRRQPRAGAARRGHLAQVSRAAVGRART